MILNNENKLSVIGTEIVDLQKHIERKNQTINRANSECATYKKQIEKLLRELKERSDSENFDEDKEKLLNVKKAREAEILQEKVLNLENEVKIKELEYTSNSTRLEQNLTFSREANAKLLSDYNMVQDKNDKMTRHQNNLIQDLKEEISKMTLRMTHLQIFKDEYDQTIAAEREKIDQETKLIIQEKEEELKVTKSDKNILQKEVDKLKSEYNQNMASIKLMELELEEKL